MIFTAKQIGNTVESVQKILSLNFEEILKIFRINPEQSHSMIETVGKRA